MQIYREAANPQIQQHGATKQLMFFFSLLELMFINIFYCQSFLQNITCVETLLLAREEIIVLSIHELHADWSEALNTQTTYPMRCVPVFSCRYSDHRKQHSYLEEKLTPQAALVNICLTHSYSMLSAYRLLDSPFINLSMLCWKHLFNLHQDSRVVGGGWGGATQSLLHCVFKLRV